MINNDYQAIAATVFFTGSILLIANSFRERPDYIKLLNEESKISACVPTYKAANTKEIPLYAVPTATMPIDEPKEITPISADSLTIRKQKREKDKSPEIKVVMVPQIIVKETVKEVPTSLSTVRNTVESPPAEQRISTKECLTRCFERYDNSVSDRNIKGLEEPELTHTVNKIMESYEQCCSKCK